MDAATRTPTQRGLDRYAMWIATLYLYYHISGGIPKYKRVEMPPDLPGGYENKYNLPRKLTCLRFIQENKGAGGLNRQ